MEVFDDFSDKITVFINLKEEKFTVSWYKDTSAEDVKEAIICACDCIIDSGFSLCNEHDEVIPFEEFNLLIDQKEYFLKEGKELIGLRHVTGDKMRKVDIDIDPLKHGEAQKGIKVMRFGSNLLKHTASHCPHLRQFQLSTDRKRLIWYSTSKDIAVSQVPWENVIDIKMGQFTDRFKKYPMPMLGHLSFSIYYEVLGEKGVKTLDLTCKNENEFDLWVCGCRALFYAAKGFRISKRFLLAHSKIFNKKLDSKDIAHCTTSFYEEVDREYSKGLEDCINRQSVTRESVLNKIDKVNLRYSDLEDKVNEKWEDDYGPEMSKYEGNETSGTISCLCGQS